MDLEADDFSEVAETLSAEHEVVLADEADVEGAPAALAGVLSEFAGVASPEGVRHGVVKLNTNIFIQNTFISVLPF